MFLFVIACGITTPSFYKEVVLLRRKPVLIYFKPRCPETYLHIQKSIIRWPDFRFTKRKDDMEKTLFTLTGEQTLRLQELCCVLAETLPANLTETIEFPVAYFGGCGAVCMPGCTGSCVAGCADSCTGSCTSTCSGSCEGVGCKAICTSACAISCHGYMYWDSILDRQRRSRCLTFSRTCGKSIVWKILLGLQVCNLP